MAKTQAVQKILAMAGKFVVAQEGNWDHAAWEKFLNKAAKLGVELDDGNKHKLGELLEAAKYFHACLPGASAMKKSGCEPKAKATSKKGGKKKEKKKAKDAG